MWSGARSLSATAAPQVGCRKTLPPLTSTSATAQVAPLLAAKAISCKPAVRRRRLPLAQVQQLQLLRRRPQQLRPRQLLRQQLQPPRRLLVPQRLLRRRGLLHHQGHARLHIPDRKTDRSAISNQLVIQLFGNSRANLASSLFCPLLFATICRSSTRVSCKTFS
jgi:hypothetical protein